MILSFDTSGIFKYTGTWTGDMNHGMLCVTPYLTLFCPGPSLHAHPQSPRDGILKNMCCNIPFQTKHIS